MRRTRAVLAVMILLAAASASQAYQPGCVGCNRSGRPDLVFGDLSGPACASPPGYAWVPGCCEPRRPCCDNAWAGYCERRARIEAHHAAKSHCRHGAGLRVRGVAAYENCEEPATRQPMPTPALAPKAPQPGIAPSLPPAENPPAPPVPPAAEVQGKTR